MVFSFVGMKSNASIFSARHTHQNSQSSKISEASTTERHNPFSNTGNNFGSGNFGGTNGFGEPMEDDISPYDSVSNWGEEQMEQSFESKGSSSPMKNHDASMRSDAMSILSEAVATTVTTASIVLKAFVCIAVFMNLIFFYFLVRKVIDNAPAKGRMTLH